MALMDLILPSLGKIDTARIPVAKERLCAEHPIPKDENGEEIYDILQWMSLLSRNYLLGEMRQGKKKLDALQADDIAID